MSSAPWLLVIDPQRIFADPASEWCSPFFPPAMENIARLAAAVGPERTLVTRWLPRLALRGRPTGGSALRAGGGRPRSLRPSHDR